MDIHFDLPPFLWELIDQIRKHGYECFLVGGAVRDMLLGKEPKDYDLATNATVSQIEFVFDGVQKINNNGRKHGTVTVRTHKNNVEISTYRFEEGRRLVTLCTAELETIRQRIDKVTSAVPPSVEPLDIL